ncbi:hypothetical protein I4F81_004907 [Pyropia yezoensis]|uniref:Uncharacterized protein n=1 Tax=Pyropia yezoensis TaxID=2788 RepID=A0ACC3BXI7_PYRYE|nr:hypothetical protein I4F81_004907 [Neopyropia yezoensis]
MDAAVRAATVLGSTAASTAGEVGEDSLFGALCNRQTPSSCLLAVPNGACDEACQRDFTVIIFPFIALLLGVLAQPMTRVIRFPYTLMLLVLGALLGALGCGVEMGLLSKSLRQWVHLSPPNTFFFVFLSPLIFEAAFNTEWHIFKRLFRPICLLAFVIVILQVFAVAAFQRLIIQTPGWSWWSALMFGSMLSATDPISVTATLKSVGASEYLNTLIEGESLINDGSAFVLFEAFFTNARLDGEQLSAGEIVLEVIRLSLGGVAMGLAFGLVALIGLALVCEMFEVETSITVITAFLGFWTAQSPARLSGVICNVTSGLLLSALGKSLITPSAREPLAHFWELLGWMANTIVFVYSGVLVTAFSWSCAGAPHEWQDYIFVLAYFAFLQVLRFALLGFFHPALSWRQKWYTWRQAVVVGLSGLRGAVSLILALEVGESETIPDEVRSRVVLWTTGVVALSLLVNGLTISPALSLLGLNRADPAKADFLARARALMQQKTYQILDSIVIDGFFKSARWSYVRDNVIPESWTEGNAAADYARASLDIHPGRTSLTGLASDMRRSMDIHHAGRRLSMDPGSLGGGAGGGGRRDSLQWRTPPGSSVGTPRLGPSGAPSPSPSVVRGAADRGDRQSTDRPRLDGTYPRPGGRLSVSRPVPPSPRLSSSSPLIIPTIRPVLEKKKTGEVGTDLDREVRRRVLMAMLSHVRTGFNINVVELGSLAALSEDLFKAMDANDEGRPHELFVFLHKSTLGALARALHKTPLRHSFKRVQRLLGQTSIEGSIAVANVLVSSVVEVLKEEWLLESPLVAQEVESLYENVVTFLNRLETLDSHVFAQVQTDAAVRLCYNKQVGTLEDLRESGALNDAEFHQLSEELIEQRCSYFLWNDRFRRPGVVDPHAVLRRSPFFGSLDDATFSRLVRKVGRIQKLTPSESVPPEGSCFMLVLDGALRIGSASIMAHRRSQLLRKQLARAGIPSHRHGQFVKTTQRQVEESEPESSASGPSGEVSGVDSSRKAKGAHSTDPPAGSELDSSVISRATEQPPAVNGDEDAPVISSGTNTASASDGASGEDGIQDVDYAAAKDAVVTFFEELGDKSFGVGGSSDERASEAGSERRSRGPSVDVLRGRASVGSIGDGRRSLQLSTGCTMHWCFPVHSVFCGPTSGIALFGLSDDSPDAQMLNHSLKLLKFSACEIASAATVFWLPIEPLRQLCRQHPLFRTELARAMARLLVLEYIADEPPYALSHSREALALNSHEGHAHAHAPDGSYAKVSQAGETLSKLPYMTLMVMTSARRRRQRIVHGPGILLHGTVRVSVVDTSGLAGAVNLLHERLVSPALLPSGALIIDALFEDDDEGLTDDDESGPAVGGADAPMGPLDGFSLDGPAEADSTSERKDNAADTPGPSGTNRAYPRQRRSSRLSSSGSAGSLSSSASSSTLPPSTDYTDEEEEEELDPYDLPLADRVELLVEDNQSVVEFAMARVTRWTARAEVVDASCRFGAYRHVDHRWLGR